MNPSAEIAATPSTVVRALEYQPEIDGLRAIAVLSVFLFHLDHRLMPGGFVGVDVFYVISGYLITSLLYRDCLNGNFSFARFYQRRIARLFPAFFLVAFVTIAVAGIVYLPQDFASAGANLAAAALSVANFKYMLQGNYFQISPDAQPFLHYWSLSVEEQFYLIFPAMLLVGYRYFRAQLVPLLVLLAIGSLGLCLWVTHVNHVWAFYLLPARAWEPGVGGLLAVLLAARGNDGTQGPAWLFPAGLILTLASFWLIHGTEQFPAWRALLPVGGTAAVIASSASYQGLAKSALSSAVATTIGRMSYSLYLWHWPVFSLIDYEFFRASSLERTTGKIVLSLGLAALTLGFIERPSRRYLNQARARTRAFVFMGAVVAAGAAVGLYVRNQNYVDAPLSSIASGGLEYRGPASGPTVALLGDSNGSMYAAALRDLCKKSCSRLNVMSVAAGDSLPNTVGTSSSLWIDSIAAISRLKPDFIVMANAWTPKLDQHPERLHDAVAQLAPYTRRIIILDQPPTPPAEASRAGIRESGLSPYFENAAIRARRRAVNEYLHSLEAPSVLVIHVAAQFESTAEGLIIFDDHGHQLYQDTGHLSAYGAARIVGMIDRLIGH